MKLSRTSSCRICTEFCGSPLPSSWGKGSGDGGRLLLIPARIQGIAQTIAHQIEAEHGDHDQDAGREDQVHAS